MSTIAASLILAGTQFRAPAIPLITHDPYFSIWSFSDHLADGWTKHWTGKNQALCGMVRVDGKTYRWLSQGLAELPKVNQTGIQIRPGSTTVEFDAGGVKFRAIFEDPSDIARPEILTLPASIISMEAQSVDGKTHRTEVYLDASAEICVDNDSQSVSWSRLKLNGEDLGMMQIVQPQPLGRVGDDLRIEWGKLVLKPIGEGSMSILESELSRKHFAQNGHVSESDSLDQPRQVIDGWPVISCSSSSSVSAQNEVIARFIVAYDDSPSIEYFRRQLVPIWASRGRTFAETLSEISSHQWVNNSSKLYNEWQERYGENYANLATLAYRQCLAGYKTIEDIDGTLLMFPKENFSNGCISTVDVIYPACPIFLAYNPALLKANLEPVMQYASMKRWKWDFAPHDLGTYPKANGQVYGGGERTEENQMPVEESGNMLIMAAAYYEKSGDKAFIEKYWPTWTKWANFLKNYGLDPGIQLCTDDFAGHLAHNSNLSIKAIVALASYGKLCEARGDKIEAKKWRDLAKVFATEWLKLADDGDHFRLAFDKSGSWSQKYNLVWDKILGLGLFPDKVYQTEVAWYLKHQNKYGLPLDNRADYTKLDWTVWTACLTSNREDFEAIMSPLYRWMNETPDRIPLTDWFDTKTGKCIGFRARTVVGGVFLPMLLKK